MSSNKSLPMESVASVALAAEQQNAGSGLEFPRHFTREGSSPYDEIEWEIRSASITNEKGEVLFQQEGVEIPKNWSQTATNIVVSKYFHGQIGTPQRERSVRQLVERVVRTMTEWGVQGRILCLGRGCRGVSRRTGIPASESVCRVQLARVVQLRHRAQSAMLGLLHQLRRRYDGIDPESCRARKVGSLNTVRAPAPIFPRCVPRGRSSRAAAPLPGRSAS